MPFLPNASDQNFEIAIWFKIFQWSNNSSSGVYNRSSTPSSRGVSNEGPLLTQEGNLRLPLLTTANANATRLLLLLIATETTCNCKNDTLRQV